MKTKRQLELLALGGAMVACLLSGCSSVGGPMADVGLASAGGVAGYELSGGRINGAAIGAATGFLVSKIAQTERQRALSEAQKLGYDRAMNQAVKQQYWIIQNQQRATDSPPARYVPVQLPAQTIDGVITNPTVEYIRVN